MRSVAALTLGLPSRSPPIQWPMRRNGGDLVARAAPVRCRGTGAGSRAGRSPGSTTARSRSRRPRVSLAVRSMRVCHSCVTRARISASLSARSRSVCQARRARPRSRRSRARRRGCSCAAPRSGARSAPARCRPCAASAAMSAARRSARCRRSKHIASEPSCRWPSRSWCGAPAHVVAVLGDVGQVREVAERADHAHRLVAGQVLQQPVEHAPGAGVASSAGRPPTAGARVRSARRRPVPSCSRITSPRMRPSNRISSTSGLFFSAASSLRLLPRAGGRDAWKPWRRRSGSGHGGTPGDVTDVTKSRSAREAAGGGRAGDRWR